MRASRILTILCLFLAASSALVRPAVADDTIGFIRDAEIETILRTWWTPILQVAGIDPQAAHIYIVNDPQLNAFVAGGQNLFLNTGTLLRSTSPNQIVGIMAHETGHIAGGHISRSDEVMRNATIAGIIAMVAGMAAAAASHNADAAGAAVLGGEGISERSWLMHSVVQEASADHAAMTFLDRSHQSARGLLEFFRILEQEMLLSAQHEDPYLRDHPLTRDRIEYVRQHVDTSPWSNTPDPPEWIVMHQRMKAKLEAFLSPPAMALAKYKADDTSIPARYARAVAYYRVPQLKQALDLIDGLIAQAPNDPYFQELKGQMLFENGKVRDALAPYQRSVDLLPDNALLKIELAQVQLETNDPALVPAALNQLNTARRFETDNGELWRLLAIAYGRGGDMGMMSLSLAEQGMADGNYRDARQQATRATKLLPPGPQRQRAQDIADDARRSNEHESGSIH